MADTVDKGALVQYAIQMAEQYGIDPNVFVAQLNQESGFDPTARNPVSGATGIGQLMPQYYQSVNLTDPYSNIKAAAATDAGYLQRYNGDYNLMLAAYNAGPGNVDKYGGVPPFDETRTYVKNIMGGSPSIMNNLRASGVIMGSEQTGANDPNQVAQSALGNDPNVTTSNIPQALGAGGTQADSSAVGGPDANNADNPVGFTKEQWFALVQQHGGLSGYVVVDPKVTDSMTGEKTDNLNPQYRYTFNDGTNITMQAQLDNNRNVTGYTVTNGGTALKASAKSGATQPRQLTANTNTPYIVIQNPDGSQSYVPNPNYNPSQPINASPTDPYILTRDSNGKITAQPNPNYRPGNVKGQVQQWPDGSLHQYDPSTGQWTQIAAPDPLKQQQLQLQIAQAQKQLEPQQQQAFENANQTIDYLKQLYTEGKISLPEMNQNMDLVRKNLTASLQGTTLFQQQQEQARQAESNAQLGRDILQARLTEGTNLAHNILSTAASSHIMLPKGQSTLGLNPLSMAMSAVNALGGGQQMGDLATQLIKGVLNGQISSQAALPTLQELMKQGAVPAASGQGGGGGGQPAPNIGAGAATQSILPSSLLNGVTPGGTNESGYPAGFEQQHNLPTPGGTNESGYPQGFEQPAYHPSGLYDNVPTGGVMGPDTAYQPTTAGLSINTPNPGVRLPDMGTFAQALLGALSSAGTGALGTALGAR